MEDRINKVLSYLGATGFSHSGTFESVEVQHGYTPTLDEMRAVTDDQLSAHLYSELRADEYPPLADQLDAIWKGGAAMEEMREKIIAVKDKYPKSN